MGSPATPITDPNDWIDVPATPPAASTATGSDSDWVDVPPNPFETSLEKTTKGPSGWQQYKAGLSETASPKAAWEGIKQIFTNPGPTASAILQQHADLWHRAVNAYHQGDYATALDNALSAGIPLLGPQIQKAQDLARQGETMRAAGQLTGIVGPNIIAEGVPGAVNLARLPGRIGRAVAPAAEAAEPVESAAETAERVAQTATPAEALQRMQEERGLAFTREAYQKASPAIRQQMQQQYIFQNMKTAGGDPVKFGELMEKGKTAIPLEDHQTWSGITKVLQHYMVPGGAALAVAGHFIPALKPLAGYSEAAATIAALTNPALRGALARVGRAGLAASKVAAKPYPALPATVSLDPNRVNQWTPPPGMSGGGAVERIKRNTLRSLYRT